MRTTNLAKIKSGLVFLRVLAGEFKSATEQEADHLFAVITSNSNAATILQTTREYHALLSGDLIGGTKEPKPRKPRAKKEVAPPPETKNVTETCDGCGYDFIKENVKVIEGKTYCTECDPTLAELPARMRRHVSTPV